MLHFAGVRSGVLGSLAMSLCVLLAGCESKGPDRPDLILMTIDSLSADQLGCLGGPSEAGGSVCELAEDGTLFTWAVASTRGEASAAATLLTGLAAGAHGVADDGVSFLKSEHVSIAETLASVGYSTAGFVSTPRLNRSRRLDQGFGHYEDFVQGADVDTSASVDFAKRVQRWMNQNPAPRFIWIHANRDAGLPEYDRLVSRLSQTLAADERGVGILLVALRGDVTGDPARVDFSSHHIPLLWRPPHAVGAAGPRVSRRLVGLLDIEPTLRAAAQVPHARASGPETAQPPSLFAGRNLTQLVLLPLPTPEIQTAGDHLVFLDTPASIGEVGLASETHLYVRRPSALDGSGQPVPTGELSKHGARFAALPPFDPLRHAAPRSAGLDPGPWRQDVLDVKSPVPRLEFHLARRLGRPSLEEPR